jgi:hypothetical protein
LTKRARAARAARTVCLALALLAGAGSARAQDAPAAEPAPEALAQAWFDQLWGGDAVELWTTEWSGQGLSYGVARHWTGGRAEVFVSLLAPHTYVELNFLLREREDGRREVLYYRTPKLFPLGRKTARVMPVAHPTPLERLPFAPGLPAIAEVEPVRAADYRFTRLPDATVAKQPCRVIEGRPHATDLGFERVVYSLSRETGVALETTWFANDKLVRRVTTLPSDVRDDDGRFLPTRRTVDQLGLDTQHFVRTRLMLDPVFPEKQFTTQNLKTGRFPSY